MIVETAERARFRDSARRLGWVIAWLKMRTARNRFTLTRGRHPFRAAIQFGVLMPGIAIFTVLLAVGIASSLGDLLTGEAATTMLGALLALSAMGSLVGCSAAALQSLYLADDVPFLMTLPIPLRVMYGSKLVDSIVGSLSAQVLAVSAVVGFGISRGVNTVFIAVAICLIASLVLFATSVAIMIVSLVTRFIPAKRAKLFLASISLSLVGVTLLSWRLLAPPTSAFGTPDETAAFAGLQKMLAWTPAGWGAEALAGASNGNIERPLILTLLVVSTTAVLVKASFQVFMKTFVTGLSRLHAVQMSQPRRSTNSRLTRASTMLSTRLAALLLKEWLTLFRDLRRLSGAIWPVAIVLIYTVVLSRRSDSNVQSETLRFWSANASLALLPWGLSLGISLYAFGSEGRNIHLLRSLPIAPARLFGVKVLSSVIPVLLISLASVTASLLIRGVSLAHCLQFIALVTWMAVGYVTIDTAAAAVAPNFETAQIQRAIGLTGRAFSIVVGGLFSVATALLAFRLVAFGSGVPDSVRDVLNFDVGGFQPFGWPLVVAALGGALLCVGFATLVAIRSTDAILRRGY